MFSNIFIRNFSTTTSISITSIAFNKIKNILNTTHNDIFLLSAQRGGCNGFNYVFKPIKNNEFADIIKNKKPIIIEQNTAKVAVDPLSELYLLGTEIDYIKKDYENGIYESGFKFTPDKDIANSCGCGISFSPKD